MIMLRTPKVRNPKQARNSNLKCSKRFRILDFDIGICLGFGAWDLGFGAEPLWGLGPVELDCHAWLAKNRVDPIFKGKGAALRCPLVFSSATEHKSYVAVTSVTLWCPRVRQLSA